MDQQSREKMESEILDTAESIGSAAGVGVFLGLLWLGTRVPAVDVVLKSDAWYWPLGVFLAIAVLAGRQVYLARRRALQRRTTGLNDDALRLSYDRVRERRILSKAFNYVLLAGIVLYFVLR